MSAHRWTRAAAALVLVAGTVRGRAQAQSSDPTLARAVASLEVTETERGVELLRQLITTLPTTAPAALRRDAQVHLAIADWSLGLFDSASAHLRAAVTADPFVHLDGEEFNPDLVAALRAARRAVAALGVRAPPDTSLEPRTGGWPVAVAVTQPGTVRLRLTGPESGGRDTLLAALPVDSTATLTLPLPVGESLARTAGSYRLVVEYARPGGPTLTSTLDLDVTEQPVDTLPREPPPADSLYRLEVRWGAPSRTSLFRGIGLGLAAGVVPVLFANSQLRGTDGRAWVVGGAVSLAGLTGYFLGRPRQALPENIAYNRALRSAWETRDRAIAAANDRHRGVVLLRVRVVSPP